MALAALSPFGRPVATDRLRPRRPLAEGQRVPHLSPSITRPAYEQTSSCGVACSPRRDISMATLRGLFRATGSPAISRSLRDAPQGSSSGGIRRALLTGSGGSSGRPAAKRGAPGSLDGRLAASAAWIAPRATSFSPNLHHTRSIAVRTCRFEARAAAWLVADGFDDALSASRTCFAAPRPGHRCCKWVSAYQPLLALVARARADPARVDEIAGAFLRAHRHPSPDRPHRLARDGRRGGAARKPRSACPPRYLEDGARFRSPIAAFRRCEPAPLAPRLLLPRPPPASCSAPPRATLARPCLRPAASMPHPAPLRRTAPGVLDRCCAFHDGSRRADPAAAGSLHLCP